MADSMDLVQQRVQEELARNLANATHRPAGASEFFCLSCGEEIPEQRRRALPGVSLCVTCQDINERRAAHYRKGE
ncbi:TraR/DksA C4-type zinc finger protein [Pantoea agglomerans]|uniref:TraR/DksA C4-type zinc finger protein n=1 Tax=Enterobacter agglomerans TaxID=549 RepID=UPI000DAC887B|nr:TraR/DksA C4-type zinc finger protein [Pantoea agglomerans]RAH29146.1 TraR/DksA family transcriptional regulator [Pantoea agglomerans]TGX90744.1 TraR/DksA family transcriptional regulator [Pantoea agglomerans]WEC73244.1 TraR/DksA C4-type zinc finger protein [Pantoea agglomerans]